MVAWPIFPLQLHLPLVPLPFLCSVLPKLEEGAALKGGVCLMVLEPLNGMPPNQAKFGITIHCHLEGQLWVQTDESCPSGLPVVVGQQPDDIHMVLPGGFPVWGHQNAIFLLLNPQGSSIKIIVTYGKVSSF